MSTEAAPAYDLEATLHERFGLEHFRKGQRAVIESVLAGRDVLCVMPTGGGKSLCYQLPALLLNGPTLVVSPLIALMKDQVDALEARGIRATVLNSMLDPAEQRARLFEIQSGRYDLVYVAPERFRSSRFVEIMSEVKPALLAVDEAHCISEWGHDFRPDYSRLGLARKKLGSPPCIALTATATDLVRRDIAHHLDLNDPLQFVSGFDRPNLSYEVVAARRDPEKLERLARTLEQHPGSAVVYASSRARCENVAQYIEHELRRSVVVYHAGLPREDRTAAQDAFMEGRAEIVVATNAFGMGVDKPDIRSVIHFNMPGTLEAYYQEAGRAGRDGDSAACVLLYAIGDRKLHELFIENEYPPKDVIHRIYEYLRLQDADPIELTHGEIKERLGLNLSESAVGAALKILETAGGLERFHPRENMAIIRINTEPEDGSLVDRLGPQAHVQRMVLMALEALVDRRLREPVYIAPDEIAGSLGLDRTALTRAIRALTADLPIDYVPPFRGNAIRVIDRDVRAKQLPIDFQALNVRRQKEFDKLDRMITYAESRDCRRETILGYFGDPDATACGNCDNCARGDGELNVSGKPARAIDTPGGREVLLKALSGVARAKGRFGKTAIAQMLAGSNSEKVTKSGLASLSTFGILSAFRQPEIAALLDALTAARYLESEEVDRFRPILKLSDKGRDFLKASESHSPSLSLPDPLFAKVRNGGLERIARTTPAPNEPNPPAEDGPPADLSTNPLYNRLRSMRTAWATEAAAPPYTIFSNAVLEDLVRQKPRSAQELQGIKGFGPSRMEKFGAAILAAIQGEAPSATTPAPAPIAPPAPSPPPVAPSPPPVAPSPPKPPATVVTSPAPVVARAHPDPSSGGYVPTEEWTWRLVEKGFGANECAAIRSLEVSAIFRHLVLCVRKGKPVPAESLIPAEWFDRFEAAWVTGSREAPEGLSDMAREYWNLFQAWHK